MFDINLILIYAAMIFHSRPSRHYALPLRCCRHAHAHGDDIVVIDTSNRSPHHRHADTRAAREPDSAAEFLARSDLLIPSAAACFSSASA